jgi:hypothetical protein
MKMSGHQGPYKTAGLTFAQNTATPLKQIIAVGAVPENLPAFDASSDNVMQRSRCI